MKRIGMMKIKDILRHRHDFELPRAQIAAAVGGEHGDGLACACPGGGGGAFLAAAVRARR